MVTMKDKVGAILGLLGIALVMGAAVYGAYLIHPVLGVLVGGIELCLIAKVILDD